jgi:hypothetical protein
MPLPLNVAYDGFTSPFSEAEMRPRDARMHAAVADVAPDPPALIFNAYTLGSELRVQWGRLVVDTATLKTAARYTLSGPGSPVVTGVAFHGTYVTLTYSGTLAVGSTYNLTVAASTATANGDLTQNDVGTVSFIGTQSAVTPPPALTFVAYTLGTQLRVYWGRPVVDTLTVRTANRYTITGPSTVTVTAVAYYSTHVVLSYTGNMLPGQTYTLTVAADTAEADGDGESNAEGSSQFRGADDQAPTVSYSPTPETPLDPGDELVVEVEDVSGLRGVVVTVDMDLPAPRLGISEVVYGEGQFKPQYAANSTLEVVGPGHIRFRIRRTGGWLAGVRIAVYAADLAGNEVQS